MYENSEQRERVILVGAHRNLQNHLEDTSAESMHELAQLAETAGAEVLGEIVQNREAADRATFIGEGKLLEIKEMAENLEATLLIFDDELTGSQLKNIEKITECSVIDRSALILDIFAGRALSGEGKLQVELAQLKYNLPRLTGGYQSLSRLGGGIGTRGPGETKLESDRRHIRSRITALEKEIAELSRHRELLRARRRKNEVPTAALVGYTNAGKSTLLNALTDAGVLAENMLFATLDPTVRALSMEDGREAMLIDTVGFIRKLPHHLIEAFKSTLEEAVTADVLVHVIDASSPEMENQIAVVERLLHSLGCGDKPILSVFNKCDIAGFTPRPPLPEKAVYISAKNGDGLETLLSQLDELLPGKRRKMELLIPYTDGNLLHTIRTEGELLSEDYTPEGTAVICMADAALYAKLKKYQR
ncbi:MAG: GTPase HflX [Ruminococcaceae bacterium]|nr:GTPase HflX [Oscillospiraceae bacterium]